MSRTKKYLSPSLQHHQEAEQSWCRAEPGRSSPNGSCRGSSKLLWPVGSTRGQHTKPCKAKLLSLPKNTFRNGWKAMGWTEEGSEPDFIKNIFAGSTSGSTLL